MDIIPSNKKWLSKTKKERRQSIEELEIQCKALEKDNKADMQLLHYHMEGVYARELHIPKDTTLVGEIHKFDCINIVSKGKIEVVTDEGIDVIEAPITFVSPAGTKRAGYTLEDTIWTTIHQTETEDVDEIRKNILVASYDEFDQLEDKT